MQNKICFLYIAMSIGTTVAWAQSPVPLNVVPTRIVGHPQAEQNSGIASSSPNLVEGRELLNPTAVALDTSVSPNILYVSDTGNNRVLAWRDATGFRNGQKADLVIGQSDLMHTTAQGPGQTFQTGLTAPTGIAVYNGDLYVADSGNNRVLRFQKPFQNINSLFPDLWIGQPSLGSRTNNYTGRVAAQGLSLSSGTTAFTTGLVFDKDGNLWVVDPGNRRVLQFKAADVSSGGGPLTASLEIGQNDFSSVLPNPVTGATRTTANQFATPSAIAYDPASGRLFVSDNDGTLSLNRVLVFQPPFSNGMSATRIMGVFPPTLTTQPTTDQLYRTLFFDAEGIFVIPGSSGKIGLVDNGASRILLFDPVENWPAVGTTFSPLATAVVGQTSFDYTAGQSNGGLTFTPAPTNKTLARPSGAVFSGTELFVADTANHRVAVLPYTGGTLGPASRVLGQDSFTMSAPNLIEGREFDFASGSGGADAGMTLDTTGDTPHLYVADTYNNRILGFRDFRKLAPGAKADIVIGQPDFNSGLCNVSGDPNGLTASTLCQPTGVIVDAQGNLLVADSFNGRVLRFPAPFSNQGPQIADLVLGQRNFVSKITQPGPSIMGYPYGLAFAGTSGLLVSDRAYNRVLFFEYVAGSNSFTTADSAKPATKVFGQPDFFTIAPGTADNRMSQPSHIATDNEARTFVTDTTNNRVLVFDQISSTPSQDAFATLKLGGLNAPRGIFVNQITSEVWVTDTNQGAVRKYPSYQFLLINQASTAFVQSAGATLAVVQDQFGNLVVADSSNRVGVYFPSLEALNGANFIGTRPLAPGLLASVCSPGSDCDPARGRVDMFGTQSASLSGYPMNTTLADLQVLFNGQATPLYYVSPSQINFVVPMGAPTSGTAQIEVVQPSTGRVYGAGSVGMSTNSPGLLTLDYGKPNRQAAAINLADGSVNTTTNGAARGTYVALYGTGQGFIPNGPPDGAQPNGEFRTPLTPRININGNFLDSLNGEAGEPPKDQWVQFSGLSPQYPGLWQINIYLPKALSPSSQSPLLVQLGSSASGDFATTGWRTTIAIKN